MQPATGNNAFFWNPTAETQFFFNDPDAETGNVFTVLLRDCELKAGNRTFGA